MNSIGIMGMTVQSTQQRLPGWLESTRNNARPGSGVGSGSATCAANIGGFRPSALRENPETEDHCPPPCQGAGAIAAGAVRRLTL
jgi:hypothetical protein